MINNLKVIDDTYLSENEKYYELDKNKFPINHELSLGKEIYLVVGNNGTGKSTFLKGLEQSAKRKYNPFSQRTFRSEDKLPLFNDLKGNFDFHNFEHFFNLPVFDEKSFKRYQSKNENLLIKRISRNISNAGNVNIGTVLSNLENKFGKSKIEILNRMAYIIESGINIINTNYPQTLFQNYEILFKGKGFDIVSHMDFAMAGKIKRESWRDWEDIPEYKGKNEGEKVLMSFGNLIGRSYNNPLFLLDEPTRSLSKENSLKVGEEIKTLKGQKFIATHDEQLINLLGKNSNIINFDKSPVEVTNSY